MDANELNVIKELITTLVHMEAAVREITGFFCTFVVVSWLGKIIAFFIKRSDALYYYRKSARIIAEIKGLDPKKYTSDDFYENN